MKMQRPETASSRASTPVGTVVTYSFFASVVRPLVEVTADRMRRDRMTYDDLNELFWGRGCLSYQPIVTEPRCVTAALQHCANMWLDQAATADVLSIERSRRPVVDADHTMGMLADGIQGLMRAAAVADEADDE